jgi:imidazolonepropionase-like amidohydrolase
MRPQLPSAIRRGLFAALLFATLACIAGSATAADYLELTDFNLIDGTGAAEHHVARLLARDGVIVAIDTGNTSLPMPEPGAQLLRIDLHGGWVMPGLVDTHTHVARFPDTREHAERILRQAIRGGVTSVRDMAGDARALSDIERAMGAGEFIGPNLVYSALFGGPGIFIDGPTSQMASGRPPGGAPWARAVTDATDLRQVIAEAKGTGATNAKVYGNLDAALAKRLIVEARRQGMQTAAHATVFPARPSDLVAAGIGSLSHAPYLVWEAVDKVPADYGARTAGPWSTVPADHPRLLALYRSMARRGVFLDATLYVYKAMRNYSPQVKADWTDAAFAWAAKATRIAHAEGVQVTTGTDWFEPARDGDMPHTHDELALLVEAAGFSPMEAIIAGTRNGAAAMGLGATHGTVERGKVADLLVLDADPLIDIHNTTRLRMTIRNGVPVTPE